MRIGMVLKEKIPPPDIRVEKEAHTLVSNGHEVFLLLEGRKGEPLHESYAGMSLTRGVTMSSLVEKLHRYTFSFTFRSFLWGRAIERFAVENRVDAIHVHDLPLVGEGVRAARKLGIPVVADLHENYPAGLQVWYSSVLKKTTIYNFNRWAAYERSVLQKVDRIVVVIEEARDRLVALGVPAEKIYVVPNTAIKGREKIPVDDELVARYRGKFVLSYIGGFASHRGLDTLIRAVARIKDKLPELVLVLVGDRNKPYMDYLKGLASRLGCAEKVEFAGWQPFDKIWSYIRASEICLVPHARNPHTDSTIPHKIFQYMMMSKPVIVSDCPPLKRVIEESGGGLWFLYDSSEELADRIMELYANADKRKRMGEAGREAFIERFNWDATAGPLIELYDSLERSKKNTGKDT